MLAATLHAYLRMPLGIPGHNGLIFMTVFVFGQSFINKPMSGLVSAIGASSLLYLNVLGFKDPYIFIPYILIGVIMDLLGTIPVKGKWRFLFIGIIAGIAYTCIPLHRFIIMSIGLYQNGAILKFGLPITILSHFAFALSGGMLGYFTNKAIK